MLLIFTNVGNSIINLQNGAPKVPKLPYKWLNSMVYGRYNYS